jgi:Leucine Rich Repeat (LRR) protein
MFREIIMRHLKLLLLLLCFIWILPLQAQDDPNAYEIALQRIEEARLSGATELDLSYLGLTEIPPEIGQLTNLQSLFLYNNQLSSLPAEFWRLSNLQRLILNKNSLIELSPEIGQLRRLEQLSLAVNQLTSLPPEIGNLTNLQSLMLFRNELRNIPIEIGNLSNLQILSLANNRLNTLPAEIGNLTNLCLLDIGNNELQYLPQTFSNLKQLTKVQDDRCLGVNFRTLVLDGNPLITPPQEVIDEGTESVLAYLRNQAWWHLQRIIMSAASGVGFLALVVLGLRWRYHRLRRGKKKREI